MTTTATETATLTAQDIQALRTAETVVFRHYQGVTTIEASLRDGLDGRVYTARQQRLFSETDSILDERKRTIVVAGRVTYYDDDSKRTAGSEASGFSMIHSSQYSQTWRTVASLLKAGDVLSLHFNGDRFSNGYSKAAFLHVDALHLEIKRGKNTLTFIVDVETTPSNSARMVKPTGY